MAMKARTQQEFKRKWVGLVEIKTGDASAKLTCYEVNSDGEAKTFPSGLTEQKFKLADFSKLAQRVIKPGMTTPKKFRVRLNDDGDEVETVTPVNGTFPAKLAYLGPSKKDQDPAPYEKFFHKGKPDENSHLEFFASYKITQGVFKGMELPAYFLHYKFEGIPEGEEDEGFTRFDTVDTPKASQLHKLQAWAEVHGNILDEPIKWIPDEDLVFTCRTEPIANILPVLQERALDADREVDVFIDNGYIEAVQSIENYEEIEVEEESETDELDEDDEAVEKAFPKEEKKPAPKPAKSPAKKLAGRNKPIIADEPKHEEHYGDNDDDL